MATVRTPSRLQILWARRPRDARSWRSLLLLLAIGALIVAIVLSPTIYAGKPLHNWGFGPDWDCTHPGKGEPICTKRIPAHPVIPPDGKSDH